MFHLVIFDEQALTHFEVDLEQRLILQAIDPRQAAGEIASLVQDDHGCVDHVLMRSDRRRQGWPCERRLIADIAALKLIRTPVRRFGEIPLLEALPQNRLRIGAFHEAAVNDWKASHPAAFLGIEFLGQVVSIPIKPSEAILPALVTDRLNAWSDAFFGAEKNYVEAGAGPEALAAFNVHLVTQAKEYWDEFVGPLTKCLEDDFGLPISAPLTFATQGVLDALPIHAAWREQHGVRRHLIEDRVVRFAPGLTALSLLRDRTMAQQLRGTASRSLAAFVAPVWSGMCTREDLASARDIEWPRVSTLAWSNLRGPFVGEKATAQAFLALMNEAASAPAMTDLLLSTHAFFDPVTPENSALLFAGESGQKTMVRVADLLALKPACGLDHVAMPACRSAQSGLTNAPDESIGLVAAMIQAGAASVMSCLYSVADDTAADLVPEFFERRLATGKDIAEVLRDTIMYRLNSTKRPEPHSSAVRLSISVASSTNMAKPSAVSARSDHQMVDWASFKPICFG